MDRDTAEREENSADAVNLRDLIDDLDAVVWQADPATFDFIFVNRRAIDLLGYERAEWYERDFWCERLIYGPDRAATVATCREAVRERRDHQIEYRAVRADGRIVWLRDFIRVIVGDDGRVSALRGVMVDVTPEKSVRAELDAERARLGDLAHERELNLQALSVSESHYRRLVQTSPYSVFVTDEYGVVTEVNEAAAVVVGMTAESMLGRHFRDFVAPEMLAETGEKFIEILAARGRRIDWELNIVRPSGERRLLSVSAAAIMLDDAVAGVHGVARDITEERATDSQRRLLTAALDNLPDAVSITDRETRLLYTNRAHAELLGYDRDEPPSDALAVMPDANAREQIETIYASLERDRRWSGRMRRRRADGSVVVVTATIFAVSDGGEDYALTVMRDASVEITRDQHLRRVERLASLGTLIGGVSHELNNPLTAVVGFAHLMLLDERSDEDRETLETMAREAERAARIVSDLRLVARNTQEDRGPERSAVELNEVVRHVVKVRRYSLETRNIELEQELDDGLPPVWANRAQLEQIVVNVLVNAEQALDRAPGRARRIKITTRLGRGGVALCVADNGPGIKPEHIDRIFDPFFTTKPPGEGTGLGLSLVHSIVTEHGGSMRVESGAGRGAEFVIELPVAHTGTAAYDSLRMETAARAARPLTVLVVDDERSIRDLLVRSLTRRGHAVLEAREGQEALRLLSDPNAQIDVIVSDVRMPGLDGEQLLAHLRDSYPELAGRVVFITGDAISGGAGKLESEGIPVLLKPFQLEAAAELVESRVAGQDSTSSSA